MDRQLLDNPNANRKSVGIPVHQKHYKKTRPYFTLIASGMMCFPVGLLSAQVFGLDSAWEKSIFALYGIVTFVSLILSPLLIAYDIHKRRGLPPL